MKYIEQATANDACCNCYLLIDLLFLQFDYLHCLFHIKKGGRNPKKSCNP